MKIAHNRVEMVGKQYNDWLVLSHSHTEGKIAYYLCQCLCITDTTKCGRTFVIDGRNIRNGGSKRCVDCGQKSGHIKQKGQIRTKRTSQESAYHYLFNRLKKDARKRKIDWTLTEEQVKNLVMDNCNYCGAVPGLSCNPLKYMSLSQKNTDGANILRNGIDRVDSSKGYEIANVCTACEQCNKAKLDHSIEDFKTWVLKVAMYQGWIK